tara:strand:+ start:31118 stop:31834 length:717 start_codon:yes stop_codon:yes gene_type:complete
MKNYINNTTKMLLLAIAIVAFGFSSAAQTCTSTIKSRSGTVMAGGPAKIEFRATANSVKIEVNKTDGKAKTTVNIYANGTFKDRIIFENGRDTPKKSKTISGVDGKNIRVDIVNQSVANKFKYSFKAIASSQSITTNGGKLRGTLMGQQNKTLYTSGSCTSKTQILIWREGGRAAANVRVYEKIGNQWRRLSQYDKLFAKTARDNHFTVNTNRELKVELRNVSIGNTLKYSMDARPKN